MIQRHFGKYRKMDLFLLLVALIAFVPGCSTVMTGVTGSTFQDAPLALAYADEEIIKDQSKVATIVLLTTYGLAVDGVTVKELKGGFNPGLRVSRSGNPTAYMVDVLPGTRALTVTFDGVQQGGGNPDLKPRVKMGSGSVSASYSGPPPFSWIRTSDITHTFKGGEIYGIGPKLLTVSGAVELYPLGESELRTATETRNKAQFKQ